MYILDYNSSPAAQLQQQFGLTFEELKSLNLEGYMKKKGTRYRSILSSILLSIYPILILDRLWNIQYPLFVGPTTLGVNRWLKRYFFFKIPSLTSGSGNTNAAFDIHNNLAKLYYYKSQLHCKENKEALGLIDFQVISPLLPHYCIFPSNYSPSD